MCRVCYYCMEVTNTAYRVCRDVRLGERANGVTMGVGCRVWYTCGDCVEVRRG